MGTFVRLVTLRYYHYNMIQRKRKTFTNYKVLTFYVIGWFNTKRFSYGSTVTRVEHKSDFELTDDIRIPHKGANHGASIVSILEKIDQVVTWQDCMETTAWQIEAETKWTILQTFSNAFSWMKMYEFRLRFHWNLFPGFELTTYQHWFRWWLGAKPLS